MDYLNKKFGKLTVIKQVDDYISPSGRHASRYLCKCDCGEEYITRGGYLSCGKSTCCPKCSLKAKALKQSIDLTGRKFGRWTVIERAESKKPGVYWKCKCECGNIGIIRGAALISGTSTSCGCFALEKLRKDHLLDLTGQKFGRLTVMHQVEDFVSPINHKRKSKWHCKCDCGNEVDVIGSDLTSGGTLSCGCYKRDATSKSHFKDLTGQKIGMLTIIKRMPDYISPDSGRPRPQFLCKCDCGNEKVITRDSIMNGTISCGCINSRGEREISNFLRKHKIIFKIQYSFPNLIGLGSAPLHFDFAVFNQKNEIIALIEYQGEQHYQPIKFFGGDTKFNKQVANDNKKRSFCKRNKIKLIEISYKDSIEEKLNFLI